MAAQRPGAAFFDLERESDRAALRQPELLLPTLRDRLVVIDEVQFAPDLYAALRPEIDDDRRPGRFLLLGSAWATSPRRWLSTTESRGSRPAGAGRAGPKGQRKT